MHWKMQKNPPWRLLRVLTSVVLTITFSANGASVRQWSGRATGSMRRLRTFSFMRCRREQAENGTRGLAGVTSTAAVTFRSYRFFELPTKADTGTCSSQRPSFLSDHVKPLCTEDRGRDRLRGIFKRACDSVTRHTGYRNWHTTTHGVQKLAQCVGQRILLDVQSAVLALIVRQ